MYACIAVALLARPVSRTYCLAIILVFHVEDVGFMSTKIQIISIPVAFFFIHFRLCQLARGLHLLAVDVDGCPAGAALCHKLVVCGKDGL